ncbi:hypothetical protein DPMN_043883 [Dreissena polymorpha]|uniref:Uncharacterized protein n=1 Tax=Dreissena polymorpha TaxID=45954 RepID=A0A9D4D3I9_DREPO|nr:hypothetical protein DPMN_043883 [Dreissena polymorpha]
MIAFYSLIAFLNATLGWLGDRVGLTPPHHPALSFEVRTSKHNSSLPSTARPLL